jgi:hypothetical protein
VPHNESTSMTDGCMVFNLGSIGNVRVRTDFKTP